MRCYVAFFTTFARNDTINLNERYMKRLLGYVTAILILLFNITPSHAVLKGYNVNETVIMLRSELKVFAEQVNSIQDDFVVARGQYLAKMDEFSKEITSAMLSLYSQQEQYTFGTAYAAEIAQKLCDDFYSNELPIQLWKSSYDRAQERCRLLYNALNDINPELLSEEARYGRLQGLAYLESVQISHRELLEEIAQDIEQYRQLVVQVDTLQSEINNNYNYILNSLLLTPDKQPTHKVYGEYFQSNWQGFKTTISGIFGAAHYYGWEFQDKWNAESLFILLAGLVAFIVGLLLGLIAVYRRWLPRWDLIYKHPVIFTIFCGWNAVTITYLVIRLAFTNNPFFASALNLAIEVCLMYVLMNYSVLLRVKSNQLIPTILSYMPTILMSLVIILYRMVLVDINVIRITYPVVLLILIVAQLYVITHLHSRLLPLDRYVSSIAVLVFSVCFAMNFFGYYYMSIYIALSWAIFIIGHLVLSCFFNYLHRIERKHMQIDKTAYLKSWRPFTFAWLFKPMAVITVLAVCLFECVHIFSISEWFTKMFNYHFIDLPGIVSISVRIVIIIIINAILINYFIRLVNYILRFYYKEKADVGAINLCRNIFAIVVWGLFIISTLAQLGVNYIGILATLGGLAIGLGVALRDTFDCLLCGIILMMGRIKIGDYVEIGDRCRGKVIDIQYRTTLIETDDGAIVSIFNNQFFDKDFRNISFSGDYQRLHIAFKVQKEIDSPKVREMLAQALIDKVPEIAKSPQPIILFDSSDRLHINMIAQVWVSVYKYDEGISHVKEALFNTLLENGMADMSVDSQVNFIKPIADVSEADMYKNQHS